MNKTDTSKEAQENIAPKASYLRHITHKAIIEAGSYGLTADEAANRTNHTVLQIRPRCSELNQSELIIDSGKRRKNLSGRNAIVWISNKVAK